MPRVMLWLLIGLFVAVTSTLQNAGYPLPAAVFAGLTVLLVTGVVHGVLRWIGEGGESTFHPITVYTVLALGAVVFAAFVLLLSNVPPAVLLIGVIAPAVPVVLHERAQKRRRAR